jgi:hypothetical protein
MPRAAIGSFGDMANNIEGSARFFQYFRHNEFRNFARRKETSPTNVRTCRRNWARESVLYSDPALAVGKNTQHRTRQHASTWNDVCQL